MPENGYIQILSVTGRAQLPLQDVAITVTSLDGTAIAMGITDRNGLLRPISVPAPEKDAGLTPDPATIPFTQVNVFAQKSGHEQTENAHLQVFPGVTTRLVVQMIPLSELPEHYDATVLYDTPVQNL